MAVCKDLECRLHLPECDPDEAGLSQEKPAGHHRRRSFARMIGGLKVTVAHAAEGPKPKDGNREFRLSASTDFRSNLS